MAQLVAAKVYGVVMTSSPDPIQRRRRARCNAEVPLLTATAYCTLQNLANCCSKSVTSGPRQKLRRSIVFFIAFSSSWRIEAICKERFKQVIFMKSSFLSLEEAQ